ncbi:DnaD domain protein [Enterococcus avium]|uniref:DnaD domain-containing protein n=1 Tax=Enterococcus avium TaxID=33945 RepID=UPI00289239EB|nr:DnaD domain protein [Enterococcus avium]MDT2427699.1 DnaD domain protein [Enterococcus avium]
MAERRMFAKTIIDSDAFLDMPLSSQALYFHLSMRADDDGFINNPKKIQRMVGSSEDDLKLLIAKRFIIAFESGVIVIKHWKIHNYIQKDRYKPTMYQDEKSMLIDKNNKSYTVEAECIHDGYSLETQVRLGKDRLGKDRLVVIQKKIHDYYENNGFGSITHKTITDFAYWLEDLINIGATDEDAGEMIIHALGIAIDNNVRKYSYVNSILKDWEKRKFTSVKQVKSEDIKTANKQSKQPAGNRKPRSESYVAMQYEVFIREKQFDSGLTLTEYAKRKKLKTEEVEELKQYIAKQGEPN